MFAPSGYVPLSNLIEFSEVEALARRDWLLGLIKASAEVQEKWDDEFLNFRAFRSRIYTFQEVRLLALEQALKEERVFVCHPDKGVWHFEMPVFMRLFHFKELVDELSKADIFWGLGVSWKDHEASVAKCVQDGLDAWQELFLKSPRASPNLFVNNFTGLIDLSEADLISSSLAYGLEVQYRGYPFKLAELRPFEGWALCVLAESFEKDEFLRRYVEALAELVFGAAVGDDFVEELQTLRPDEWSKFVFGQKSPEVEVQTSTVASESKALKFLKDYIANHGLSKTKAEFREICPIEISVRGFERVWSRLREDYPELARPGRRSK